MTTAVSLAQSVAPGVSLGFKNRIINGNMTIDQRNAGASVTPTSTGYTLDRWKAVISAASKFSVQQSTTAPSGFINSIKVTSLAATSLAAGDYYELVQIIEGNNLADFGFGTANAKQFTLSFWVQSSLTGTFGGAFGNDSGSRSYPFTYTINAANTWEQKTITVAGDTTGTWLTNNSGGMYVRFGLGVGSTYSGTAGAWASGSYESATGATSVVGTNGATFYITGVQLEVGTAATSFEFRDYGRELIMCQRYYQKSYRQSVVPGTAGSYDNGDYVNNYWGIGNGSTISGCTNGLPVTMRTSGTLTIYDLAGTSAKVSTSDSGGAFTNNVNTNARGANESSMWARIYNVSGAVGFIFAYTISAEL